MPDLLDIATRLSRQHDWFTLTKAVVRVGQTLGGYLLDVEGSDVADELRSLEEEGSLAEVITLSGVVHPPDRREWSFAFRVDGTGPHVSANAPSDALLEIAPRLRDLVGAD